MQQATRPIVPWILLLYAAVTPAETAGTAPATEGAVKVEVAHTAAGFRLLRGGEPYQIRGAGMAAGDLAVFAAHGGNSIRNWTTRGGPVSTRALLDEAHAHGVTVALGLPMGSERHGFDYDDPRAVAAQLAAMRDDVLEYRDHPALLFWIIGNELNHSYTNPRVYDAVNEVARMIHEVDPHHPATTAVAGFKEDVIDEIRTRAPDLDFISFQMYGSLFGLPEKIRATGFEAPFMITEWGTTGYWEVERTGWGAPLELDSTRKAELFRRAGSEIFPQLAGQLLGTYAFLWGQKQERTPTWFGLLTAQGEITESVDVLARAWTGAWPANRSPRLIGLRLDGREATDDVRLHPGLDYEAVADAQDPDGDALAYRWELKPESTATQSGGDPEASVENLDGYLHTRGGQRVRMTAPPPGAYRLFVYVLDGRGGAAHANIPFLVETGP